MDRRKYIAELVEKTGVRIDKDDPNKDDPIFAVVLLNRAILQDQKTELESLESLVGQLAKARRGNQRRGHQAGRRTV